MATRRELTKKTAKAYASASKGEKGWLLDALCASTGRSRDNARRALRNALKRRGPVSAQKRQPRPRTYGYDVLKVLIHVWRAAGEPCGKYLVPVLESHLTALEEHGELGGVAIIVLLHGLNTTTMTLDGTVLAEHSIDPKKTYQAQNENG